MVIIGELTPLELLFYLVLLVNRLVAAFAQPLFERLKWDKFWLMYIAWALAGILVFLTGINLFTTVFPGQLVGLILTAVCVGGGANILYDATDNKPVLAATLTGSAAATRSDATDR